ncbi:four-carbon acid sugar kinase family protein [Pseudonocardia nigra]|uniref:four-carbon acid sugar kinase family protein n=1 Tax=Pseudonocardia nigra TaxID=1921578 RepID=UPI001C5DB104|nr:four-carbon acid sugar kinase family protein [Pseudonocardia nigra]
MAPAGAVRRLAVLADDLTGAADAAAPFAARGLSVSVALEPKRPLPDVDVLALLTDNRWRPAAEAAERTRAAVAHIREHRPDLLFVKIDSTLRGRVHDDVAVALDAWAAGPALATPAFPAQGRAVRDGALLVHGETTVPRVRDRFPDGVEVLDAGTDAELIAIAHRILDARALAVGSGGLSRALAEVLVPTPHPPRRPDPATGVLLAVGTPHPTTQAQVGRLLAAGAQLVTLGRDADPAAAATAALRDGGRVVLTCHVDGEVEPDSPRAAALADDLATVVGAVLAAAPAAGLVLTGGATALAVTTALGAAEIRLRSEVAPGMPLGGMVVGDRRIPVVTKSGGFGAPDALCRAADALEE